MSRKNNFSEIELTIDDLPKNRKEVFWDVLKLRLRTLFLLAFIVFMFTIPMQIGAYLKEVTTYNIYTDFSNGILSSEEATTALITLTNQFGLLWIIFWLVFSIGFSGIMQIIKRLSWGEYINFSRDFIEGVKQNGKQYGILFFIVGLLSFISNVIAGLSSLLEIGTIYSFLGMIPNIVFIIIFFPIGMHALIIILIYNNKFNHQIRLSLFVYISNLIKTIGIVLVMFIPFMILLIPNFYVHIISRVLVAFSIPFIMLKWFLVVSDMLDTNWNIKHYPELINRGVLGIEEVKISDSIL